MARIPEHEIERLKAEISVQRLAEAQGIKLEHHGTDLRGLCPFHADREPSLVITPAKNLWHCLGACGTGGSVIDWVMKAKGVSFRHAVELLRAAHASLAAPGPVVRKGTTAAVKLEAPFDTDADDQVVLRQAVDYYHETLKQSPEALKYLQGRGLDHPEMVAHFKLGFSNRTLCYRLPEKNRKEGAEIRGRLQRLGLLRESGHEHFTGSVVIPMIDLNGNVTEIYGRKITEGLRQGTPLHMYLPGPHKGVWNEEALAVSKEIILCEALIDALTFWCADFRNVTASYGVNGFTEDHRQAFRKQGVRKVLIAYDRDEAGEKATLELAGELVAMGIDCYRILFPKGMDANEYGRKVTPATKSLAVLVNKAEWLGNGKRPAIVVSDPVQIAAPAEDERPPAAKEEKTEIPSLAAESVPPVAAAAASILEIPIEIKGDEVTITEGDRRYRIRGLGKNLSQDLLKVNVLATRGDAIHVDTLDLNVDRQRAAFIKRAAEELGVQEDVIHDPLGLRDRALMETLYSTGMRRLELANLKLYDLDTERGTVTIRQGKGKKDRMIPIGERAAAWVEKYVREARPKLVVEPDDHTVFLSNAGEPFCLDHLSDLVREHVDAANIGKRGACHMFRHVMATLMLDNGADIRYIQEMLGHADLKTTQIYTQVSIRQLKRIHAATHPARLPQQSPADTKTSAESSDIADSSVAAESADDEKKK
jgi:DNA primase catalytic core